MSRIHFLKLLNMPRKRSQNQEQVDKKDPYMIWWWDLADRDFEIIMINMVNEIEEKDKNILRH